MKRGSLFLQSFSFILAALIIVVALISVIFFAGVRRSVNIWNVNRGQRLENLVLPLLSDVYREQGRLDEQDIHRAVAPFLTGNVFAYVFGLDHEPVYIYIRGNRVPLFEKECLEAALNRLDLRRRPLTAIVFNAEVVGYLAADTLGFSHDAANRSFLQAVFTSTLIGAVIALIVALLAAFWFSRMLAGQVGAVVRGLQLLADGQREVSFPPVRALELQAMVDSAIRLQQQLLTEEQLRRQWADDVAHDLRTPVSALKLQFEGFLDGVLRPTDERLRSLFQEVERIDSLVTDLQELTRVESPEMKLEREEVDVKAFLTELGEMYYGRLKLGERLVCNCELQTVNLDRHYFLRALCNVVVNALKYGSAESDIKLDVFTRNRYTVFDVSNRGYVDPEQARHFFNRLYRGSASRSDRGTGLGLSISRAIMRAHGGDACLEQKGERTHVYLIIKNP